MCLRFEEPPPDFFGAILCRQSAPRSGVRRRRQVAPTLATRPQGCCDLSGGLPQAGQREGVPADWTALRLPRRRRRRLEYLYMYR